ncbi:unnamed protein product [Mycena citricolor]|uniref:Peptidase M20 dimerisation domain-containing protein n=1 Tax=Mycena citricolor TaxID=2018698 RepID=A0AAD2JY44_9AGAR|nr:unnamed protein product [Mycena citricolor]
MSSALSLLGHGRRTGWVFRRALRQNPSPKVKTHCSATHTARGKALPARSEPGMCVILADLLLLSSRLQYRCLTICEHGYADPAEWWLESDQLPAYSSQVDLQGDAHATVDQSIDEISPQLHTLSLKIHGTQARSYSVMSAHIVPMQVTLRSHSRKSWCHWFPCARMLISPRFAHEHLASFMASQGFAVTRSYLGLKTAFRAEFQHGSGGRVIGVNSEYDALAGIGHACGHNLIAVSGCAVAIALKKALQAHNIPGKVILLGTPAEEGGGGKIILLERGGYEEMDLCVMCHPSGGPIKSANLGSTIGVQVIQVEYFGQNAHAGAAPWDGVNALDAAFLAYSNISALRQQMRPDHRVHGVITGNDNWLPNVIPDYAKMNCLARAPTDVDLAAFVERVTNCLKAAAMATGCEFKLTLAEPYLDLKQNPILGQEFADVVAKRYGIETSTTPGTASTDFGNVTYALPGLHPGFAIPTQPGGGNHTIAFTNAAATQEAHTAAMYIAKGLACTALRALRDDEFFKQVKASFSA